ncbi:blue (type1) copper domain-containing protein [Candidatus Nitrosopumilus koreensis AR1]|uniref:Blue (Type1) copper domain-containing protein n=1 Tax=Candidatus Nitrosopumilus koreensis AR1 TaxID=1229908 RepID=K0B596_9ARCH|nr:MULTISPECIES: plastocyanin/azurin family copper-binding protein [Nitrosopumilus]AFS81338.1 blue (type1) copper domain-containing protein [Candidatus Nitrosopumilus koreensis AR1]
MERMPKMISVLILVFSISLVSITVNFASAQAVPEWVKNTALWYGEGTISEGEFLNMIKFLIENKVIVLDSVMEPVPQAINAQITIPNGNYDVTGAGFYSPLNLEIPIDTTVTWVNDDSVPHNIQSTDGKGHVIQLFNSPPLNTGDKFEFTFEESGVYNYYCSFHPWRVGLVTVS